jgi:hypothetical protein
MQKNLFKITSLILLLISTNNFVTGQEYPIEIKPIYKITTSNSLIQEGDKVEFEILNDSKLGNLNLLQGQKVHATLICREENSFLGKPASLYFDNFYTLNGTKKIKFKGILYRQGTAHDIASGFLTEIFASFIRGGEAQIKPNKHKLTIFVEEI